MSRSIALLPFEISRWAPEPVQLEEDRNFDAEADDGGEEFAEEDFDEDSRSEEEAGFDDGEFADATLEGDRARGEDATSAEEDALEAGLDSEDFEDSEQSEDSEDSEFTEESEDGGELEEEDFADEDGEADEFAEEESPADGPSGEAEGARESEGAGASDGVAEGSGEGGRAELSDEERSERDQLVRAELDEEEEGGLIGEDGSGFEEEGVDPADDGEGELKEDDFADDALAAEDAEWLARADRVALASWIRGELAALLLSTGALRPLVLELDEEEEADAEELDDLELSLSPEPGALAAKEAGAELGLACRIRADSRSVELSGLLSDLAGEERVRFALAAGLGAAHLLPLRAAHELLSALGEDVAAGALPEKGDATPVDAEAVLGLCRGARSLAESRRAPAGDPLSDPLPGLGELLAALALAPRLTAARELILRGAEAAEESATMPAFLSALEQLALMFPADAQVLLGLANYRRIHYDTAGARELLLRARDLAANGDEEAAVLDRLAALAEQEGRFEEAVQHLRAATRLLDDARLYLRLGWLLRERDPQESARSFQRAVVLDSEAAYPRLALARQLKAVGETGRAATEAARAAQLAGSDSETAQGATELLRELIETAHKLDS